MNKQNLFSALAAVLISVLMLLAVLAMVHYALDWYERQPADIKAATGLTLKIVNFLGLLVIAPLQLWRRAKQKQTEKIPGDGDLYRHRHS